jgi:hypothetical protein
MMQAEFHDPWPAYMKEPTSRPRVIASKRSLAVIEIQDVSRRRILRAVPAHLMRTACFL